MRLANKRVYGVFRRLDLAGVESGVHLIKESLQTLITGVLHGLGHSRAHTSKVIDDRWEEDDGEQFRYTSGHNASNFLRFISSSAVGILYLPTAESTRVGFQLAYRTFANFYYTTVFICHVHIY